MVNIDMVELCSVTTFMHRCPICGRVWGHPNCSFDKIVAGICIDHLNVGGNEAWARRKYKFEEDTYVLSDGIEMDGIW